METAFQPGAFQENAFQIQTEAGGGFTPGGVGLTRRRWKEIKAAWAAQKRAEREADEAAVAAVQEEATALEKTKLSVLSLAASLAAQVLSEFEDIERTAELLAKLKALTAALRAIPKAETIQAAIDAGRKAVTAAKALRTALEDQREEDEINVIILMI